MNAAILHPLLARLVFERAYPLLDIDAVDAFVAAPGPAIVFVTDDPVVQKEVLDVAVILPELARAAPSSLRVALLLANAARQASARFGVRRTPALVYFRDGGYLGAIEGLRDWTGFVGESARLLEGEVRRVPTIGVVVAAGRQADCH